MSFPALPGIVSLAALIVGSMPWTISGLHPERIDSHTMAFSSMEVAVVTPTRPIVSDLGNGLKTTCRNWVPMVVIAAADRRRYRHLPQCGSSTPVRSFSAGSIQW